MNNHQIVKVVSVFGHVLAPYFNMPFSWAGLVHWSRSASTLAVRVGDKIGALKGLAMRLREISQYLSQVVAGKLPMNQEGHLCFVGENG